MNPGLAILVCFLVITPIVVYVAWKLWVPVAQEYLAMTEEGLRRRAAGEPPVVAGAEGGQAGPRDGEGNT
jgi:hypothetical protein